MYLGRVIFSFEKVFRTWKKSCHLCPRKGFLHYKFCCFLRFACSYLKPVSSEKGFCRKNFSDNDIFSKKFIAIKILLANYCFVFGSGSIDLFPVVGKESIDLEFVKSVSVRSYFLTGIYLLKANNKNTRTRSEICSKLTIKTPERRQWLYC